MPTGGTSLGMSLLRPVVLVVGEKPGPPAEMACALCWQLVDMASGSGSGQRLSEVLGFSLTWSVFRMPFEVYPLNLV